ncbi:MAG: peptidyl-prolyl cis-trans isomerase [Gammaproteobacteria bacterium]|nr:peptidyl-prolyl cis-trans isomerase [Gammaproteobacteria bacterium]
MRRGLRAFFREPTVQFLLLGALLYGASLLHARLNDPRRIVIGAADVARLGQLYAQQFGVAPSPSQLEWLIERHVRDEVLYREGLALGLGEADEVVRRRIVQKMEFLSDDESPVAAPTAAELRAFYAAHAERYRSPARVSFTQRYFSPDPGGEAAARERAARALALLAAQGGSGAATAGDPFWDREYLERADLLEIERVFGRGELSTRVFELPEGRWSGPLRSGFGWHLVRIEAREAPRLASFAEMESALRSDWQDEQRAQRKRAGLERRMQGYRIVREYATRDAGAAQGASTARAGGATPVLESTGQ